MYICCELSCCLLILFLLNKPIGFLFYTIDVPQIGVQIVELKEKENAPCEVDCNFYLAVVKHSSIEDDPHDDAIESEIPKMYLKVLTLIEFDTFVTTHGPFTTIDGKVSFYN